MIAYEQLDGQKQKLVGQRALWNKPDIGYKTFWKQAQYSETILTKIESNLELNCYIEPFVCSISTFFNKKIKFEKYGRQGVLEINSLGIEWWLLFFIDLFHANILL